MRQNQLNFAKLFLKLGRIFSLPMGIYLIGDPTPYQISLFLYDNLGGLNYSSA